MKKIAIVLSLFFFYSFSEASTMSLLTDDWSKCPKSENEFKTAFRALDTKVKNKYDNITDKQLKAVLKSNAKETTNIEIFAPYLLSKKSFPDFFIECWASYRSIADLSYKKTSDKMALEEELAAWRGCFYTYYREVPKEVKIITSCLKK